MAALFSLKSDSLSYVQAMVAQIPSVLGIKGTVWLYPAETGGVMYGGAFTCTLCKHTWHEDFLPGDAKLVVADIYKTCEKHVCNLELGPAGAV